MKELFENLVLEKKLKVLLYFGEDDFFCNYIMGKMFLDQLPIKVIKVVFPKNCMCLFYYE